MGLGEYSYHCHKYEEVIELESLPGAEMQSPRREAQDHHNPAKSIEYSRLGLQERRHPPSAGLKCSSAFCAHPTQSRGPANEFTEYLIIC